MCVTSALDPFPTVVDPQIYRPTVGSSLTLKCDPPPSYPPGSVYWGETKNGPKVRPIENTDRVSLDYEGASNIVAVMKSDNILQYISDISAVYTLACDVCAPSKII